MDADHELQHELQHELRHELHHELQHDLQWEVLPRERMPAEQYRDVVALCSEAYEEDFSELMASYEGATHVLGFEAGRLVVHALWVEGDIETGGGPPLRTAVIEAVATRPDRRCRGLGREVMRRVAAAVRTQGFELAVLTPFAPGWYRCLGWELWRGPMFDREETGLVAVDGHELMILRLDATPPLDLDGPLVVG